MVQIPVACLSLSIESGLPYRLGLHEDTILLTIGLDDVSSYIYHRRPVEARKQNDKSDHVAHPFDEHILITLLWDIDEGLTMFYQHQ